MSIVGQIEGTRQWVMVANRLHSSKYPWGCTIPVDLYRRLIFASTFLVIFLPQLLIWTWSRVL